MQILCNTFGELETNCYIIKTQNSQIVIDPAKGSFEWIKQNCDNILAVLNTHGHFDHVYDNYLLSKEGCKIYIHKDDAFLLKADPFGFLEHGSRADYKLSDKDEFSFDTLFVSFYHYPGHTPGSSMIEVKENENRAIFSGDFLFKGSIGRWDFPFSSADSMKESLRKALNFYLLEDEIKLYPGHGELTTTKDELPTIKRYLAFLEHY